MSAKTPFTCRGVRSRKRSAAAALIAMLASTFSGNSMFTPTVHAQSAAPASAGFPLDAGDLRFIYEQIQVAQAHAAGGTLLGSGPLQVFDPQLPRGLRTVDGSFNNLVPGQTHFGMADLKFPRLTTPVFKAAETLPFDPDGAGPQATGQATSYSQKFGFVADSQPRVITNLIVDQTASNPAAVAANFNPCGSGGFVCGGGGEADPVTGSLFIPNITPDFGLSAPFNLAFAFFGQFFDHGLDLVTKGGGTVLMPLKADDPLVAGPDHIFGNADDLPANLRFMAMDRATNLPGPDGIMGTADDVQEGINTTTPWVDQNQTYTSHPSHQVFLREYVMVPKAGGGVQPAQTGKVLDGGFCAPRGTGIAGDNICNTGDWAEVKAQARNMLGIALVDTDVFNVPLLVTDPYGHFKPGPNGLPVMVMQTGPAVEGNLTTPISTANAARTGHAFLNDIAHNAAPAPGLIADSAAIDAAQSAQAAALGKAANGTCDFRIKPSCQPAGTYDDELLGMHFVTGDGRGNENIGLSAVHQIFHSEHNRLQHQIDQMISGPTPVLTAAEFTAWHATDSGSGWDYGERLFQAARFVTEMEYQHLVFEEFARKVQPLINPFLGGITSINGAISAEFAHTVYRLGHSMLPEIIARVNTDAAGVETEIDMRLFDAFLNPNAYNVNGTLTADKAAGSLFRGLSRQVANELDEFIVDSVRNTLVGLPLDLGAINIARGRSEGIPPLNVARRQFYAATNDSAVKPYASWFEFGLNIKHQESLVNFVAAYGTDPTIVNATTLQGKRDAAGTLVAANGAFMFAAAQTSGVDNIDFWVGGLAERQAVFGGLLGSTFNFVFEKQLESLQDGDRFYYLQRTDGLNMRFSLEGNSFAELVRRNTDFTGGMDILFNTADFDFSFSEFTGTAPIDLGNGIKILTQIDPVTGAVTKIFFDPLHTGKNIVYNGGPGVDRFQGDVGDDTIYGNDSADRLWGFEGNDTIHGGNGDDILFGGNGDDVLKGGGGHDAMESGPGFGADLLIGGDGNDFLLGGNDGVEHFGGPGNDIIIDGTTRTEGAFGGVGDDWIEGGDGHDGGLFGDEGNVFDLLAGLSGIGGDDVIEGGPGQDGHFGEGGDDIMLMSEGSNKFFGDYGFDWVTQRGWPFAADIELNLLALPNVPLNFNDLRNKYRFVDGASGWTFDDSIRGSNKVLCDPAAAEVAECLVIGMELTAAGAAKIVAAPGAGQISLTTLMGPTAFGNGTNLLTSPAIPLVKNVGFMGGDILLGGTGSDVLEGKLGDDLIDGDLWLNVQLAATMNPGTVNEDGTVNPGAVVNGVIVNGRVKRVDHATDLIADVFSDPQRVNPGNIRIEKTIVTPVVPRADCDAPVGTPKLNCDTAVFAFPAVEYDIVRNANGTLTVTHVPVAPRDIPFSDGSDTLRNIEQLLFSDGVIIDVSTGGGANRVAVPNVVGLSQALAAAALAGADFTSSSVNANSPTVAIGDVISQNPTAGTLRPFGSNVQLTIAVGALVPNVVNQTQANATTAITAAGLIVGSVTLENSAVAAGRVISQSPPAGTNAVPGSGVALAVSLGPANRTVPNVVTPSITQAAATTLIINAGLTLGTVTTATSATVVLGNVISSSPVAGTSVAPGSAVNIVVSSGAPQPTGLVVALGFDEAAGATAINTVNAAFNGTIRQALRVAGKIGNALQFDGVDDWVTVTDTTASPLDLTTGMTLEAWVNPTQMSGWETILMKERGLAGEGFLAYALYAHDGAPLAGQRAVPAGYVRVNPTLTTTDRAVRGTATLALNAWTHLATTYDGANQRFYVNGVLVGTTAGTGSINVANGALRIGGNNSSSNEFFRGLIDEVRVYNRALTVAEITTDMTAPIVR